MPHTPATQNSSAASDLMYHGMSITCSFFILPLQNVCTGTVYISRRDVVCSWNSHENAWVAVCSLLSREFTADSQVIIHYSGATLLCLWCVYFAILYIYTNKFIGDINYIIIELFS